MPLATNAASPLNIDDLQGGSQNVHPSVVDTHEFNGGVDWNGYRYWMAYTPYPGSNDAYENPCIAVSNDRVTWITPPGVTNPLVPEPDQAVPGERFNADVDLMLEPDGSTLHMIYREAGMDPVNETAIVYLISTADGVNWSTPLALYNSDEGGSGTPPPLPTSPTITKYGDQYVSHYVLARDVNTFGVRTAPAITGPWSAETRFPFPVTTTGKDPWHMSIRLEPNGVLRYVLHFRYSPTSIWVGDASGIGITPTNMVEVLTENPGAWDDELYRACLIPLDSGLGNYGLYYSAFAGTTWGVGYTTFVHPVPLYAAEALTPPVTVMGVNPEKSFQARVRARSNLGKLSEWSAWAGMPETGVVRTTSEAATGADTWAVICAAAASTSSAAVSSDSLSVIASISTSIISAAKASDQSGDSAAATASLESSVTGSDSVDALASAAASLSAGAAAGESWTVQAQVVANLLESAASSDQIARATENALNAAMLESSTASDQFTTSISLLAGTQDTASATDAFIAVVVTLASFSSGAVASDSFGINFGQIKNIESGAISGESWALLASLTASLSEVCSAQDVMSARADVTANIISGAIATDTFSIVNQAIKYLVMGAITLRSALNYSVNIKP